MTAPAMAALLPLPLVRRGKVREVYQVDEERLLIVTSDRISAFDVVLDQPIPRKGQVLTQLSAYWFRRLEAVIPSHFLTADTDEILRDVPSLAPHRAALAGRAMLVRRTDPIPFECVIRGYLTGSAWKEYAATGRLAGEPLPTGLREAERLDTPLFSPATKAELGQHDENIPFSRMRDELGAVLADRLRDASLAIYTAGRDAAAEQGLLVADTKFEFGLTRSGEPLLIDEVLTPDSSRFWPADLWSPGHTPPSFDKQPLRDWLAAEQRAGRWNGDAPGPTLPGDIVAETSARYQEAFRRLTGFPLPECT